MSRHFIQFIHLLSIYLKSFSVCSLTNKSTGEDIGCIFNKWGPKDLDCFDKHWYLLNNKSLMRGFFFESCLCFYTYFLCIFYNFLRYYLRYILGVFIILLCIVDFWVCCREYILYWGLLKRRSSISSWKFNHLSFLWLQKSARNVMSQF